VELHGEHLRAMSSFGYFKQGQPSSMSTVADTTHPMLLARTRLRVYAEPLPVLILFYVLV
jgi:hypothetical protein